MLTVDHISKNLLKLNKETKLISWPSEKEKAKTIKYFKTKYNFDGILMV